MNLSLWVESRGIDFDFAFPLMPFFSVLSPQSFLLDPFSFCPSAFSLTVITLCAMFTRRTGSLAGGPVLRNLAKQDVGGCVLRELAEGFTPCAMRYALCEVLICNPQPFLS